MIFHGFVNNIWTEFGVPMMVYANGLLLLYRPYDVTNDCAFSRHLRFDISYGMGMSDTITLVFRTLNDIDYECLVEIVASSPQYLIVVVRYPTTILTNCAVNQDALTIMKRRRCTRLCDLLDREVYSPYFVFTVKQRLRFLFKSNSSINLDINANFYQVTITSARVRPKYGCYRRNETICTVDQVHYCFTTGVVCDGIKNCGVDDWFDERKSRCSLPVEKIGCAPVIAVVVVLLCAFVAGGHALLRCLPSHAQSFFIFNANEDNRLCIDPLLVPGGQAPEMEPFKRISLIPVLNSLSSDDGTTNEDSQAIELSDLKRIDDEILNDDDIVQVDKISTHIHDKPEFSRKSTMKTMSEKIQDKLQSVARYATLTKSNREPKKVIQA